MNSEIKTCQNCKNDFSIEPEDFEFYKKIDVPAPTFCPDCRLQRRLSVRNERFVYIRSCDLTGEKIFSAYPESAVFPVYETSQWWGDNWDAMQYGSEYDFSLNFFEQMFALSKVVPRPARSIVRLVNSDYSNNATDLKSCYLVFNSNNSENVLYGITINSTRDSLDCSYVQDCELCYDSTFLNRCTYTHYSLNCNDCVDVYFSKNCNGCTNTFGCVNLRNKSYCLWNEQLTKEEYEAKIKALEFHKRSSVQKLKKEAHDFWQKFPVKYTETRKSVDFSGVYIFNSKNVHRSYFINEGENIKHSQFLSIGPVKDCYDYSTWGAGAELMYETSVSGNGANSLKFSTYSYSDVRNLEYCIYCVNSSDLFGCVGLRNKQYCIFNKQYSKEEYFALREKIIEHMKEMPYINEKGHVYTYGEFFPIEHALVPYNKTSAQELFPLSEEEIESKGYGWIDEINSNNKATITASELPDSINDVEDSILQEIIQDESGKLFRIVASELDLYRKLHIPLPHKHHETRYEERKAFRLPHQLVSRNTADGIEVMTPYSEDRPEIILSEKGYQDEVM